MSYNSNQYGRAIPGQAQGAHAQRNAFQAPRGYQHQPQQFFYTQQGQPFIPIQTGMGGYQMMTYGQPQAQPQQGVYMAEDNYNQMAQMGIPNIPPNLRYQAPPQPQTYTDTRRKKKETQQIPQYQPIPTPVPAPVTMGPQITTPKRAMQQYSQPQIQQAAVMQVPSSKPMATPIQQIPQQQPMIQTVQIQQQSGIESIAQRSPGFPLNEKPPGCFNIIRRGNLPGLMFQQVCVQ